MSPQDDLQQVVLKEDLDDQARHPDQERLARLEKAVLTEDSLKVKLDLVANRHSIPRAHPVPSEDQKLVGELEDPDQVEDLADQDLEMDLEYLELVVVLDDLDLAQELESLDLMRDLE